MADTLNKAKENNALAIAYLGFHSNLRFKDEPDVMNILGKEMMIESLEIDDQYSLFTTEERKLMLSIL